MKLDAKRWRDSVTVADGAWSTQLHAAGLPPDLVAETANLTHPHLVSALAQEYLSAGARVLTTNTFAANRTRLEKRGVQASVGELNREAVRLARQASTGHAEVVVVGSMGPSGKILAVREMSEEALGEVFAEQARALAEAGVDGIVLETFCELAEALLALRAVKSSTNLPVIASLSFDSGPQRTRTVMGAEAGACAQALQDAGADAIGSNCGAGVAHALPAVVALRAATSLPLWVKPSAGLPDLEHGHPVYHQSAEDFGARVPDLLEAGANVIGGCCGTGPAHIKRVAALVARRMKDTRRGKKT